MEYKEIEVRFLEIDAAQLISKLKQLSAVDHGEQLLEEVIIYDEKLTWRDGGHKFLRLRTYGGKTYLAYKHRREVSITGVDEIEFEVGDAAAAEELFVRLGYVPYRHQEKRRHSFTLGEVTIDIDTWPRVPTYVELEGPDEDSLKFAAAQLGLDWNKVELRTPRMVIEEVYKIPVGTMQWFTFERFE